MIWPWSLLSLASAVVVYFGIGHSWHNTHGPSDRVMNKIQQIQGACLLCLAIILGLLSLRGRS